MNKGFLKETRRAKQEGLIRHIGFSFHAYYKDMKYIIDNCDTMEMAIINYNLYDRSGEGVISYANNKGVGLVNMGALCVPGLKKGRVFRQMAIGKRYNPYEITLNF